MFQGGRYVDRSAERAAPRVFDRPAVGVNAAANSLNFDRSTGAIVGATTVDGGQGQDVDVGARPATATPEKVEDGEKDCNVPDPSSDGGPIPGTAGSIAPCTFPSEDHHIAVAAAALGDEHACRRRLLDALEIVMQYGDNADLRRVARNRYLDLTEEAA